MDKLGGLTSYMYNSFSTPATIAMLKHERGGMVLPQERAGDRCVSDRCQSPINSAISNNHVDAKDTGDSSRDEDGFLNVTDFTDEN